MDIRVVAYKNIFSSAGVIKEFPVGTSIETVRKAFNLSKVARILCNDKPYTEITLQEGCEYSIYESVQGDFGDAIMDMGSSAYEYTKRKLKSVEGHGIFAQILLAPGFYTAGLFYSMSGGLANSLVPEDKDKSGSSGPKDAITSRPDIAGAKNQSLTGTSVPIILGTRRITPGVVGTYWTQPTTTDAGEDIYLHGLLVAGYGPLMLRDFKLGDMPLGISTPRASVGNVVLTASKATSNFLAEGDEAIFHIRQGEGTLDPRTYTKKVVEESVETEIIWPELNPVGAAITRAEYLASSPTRMTAMGVKSVSVMISANGFMHYNGNEEQAPDPITFTMYWRHPGESEWRSFYGPTPAITINQAHKKEVRFNLTADWPQYTAGINKAIEVTVVRSRTNRIDSKPDSDHSYLDSWRWNCIRTITNEEPLSAELCKKVCRIAFRIKATDRLAGTLDTINMIATSILPVVKANNKWDLAPPSLPNYPSWEETENPADFFVAAFMDRWLLSEPYASGGMVNTGVAKLSLWQLNNIKIDWTALADFRRWCAEPRTVTLSDGTTYALDHQAEVNAYITGQRKLSDFLNSILSVARAQFIYKDGKYSLIHDALYSGRGYADENLYNDKIHGKYVSAVLTPRIAKLTFARKFADIYDEAVITFVTKAAKYYQQVSVTIRNPYIASADYNARKANGTLRVFKSSVDNITDVYQIKLWVTYMFAVSQHRQLTASAQIGHAQYAYPIGSRIAISHDAILKGYGSARIVRCEGTAPNIVCTLDDEITAQSSNIYVTAQEKVNLTNTEPWYLTTKVPSANIIEPIALADGYITFRKFKLPGSLKRGPKEGDLCIFGQGTTIQEDFILVGKTVNEDHGAILSLVAAADAIHDIDSNTYTAYSYAVSPTRTTVKAIAERSRPAAPNAQAQVGMIDSVLSEVNKIEFGDETVPPSDVPGITAIAYEDYISVEIDWNESGLNNTLSYFSIEVFNGSKWEEYIATSAFSRYTFYRTLDGYPERTGAANALENWRVRATAINIYGQESLGYGPSAAGVTLDVSNYKTWIPAVPVIKKWKAHETGIDYEFTVDQDSYYGLNKRFTLTVQGTPRIVDTKQTAGVFLFDRDVDGYPETIAERTAHNIVGGSALEQKTLTVRAITDYMEGAASASVAPDVSTYLTWIPHVPTLRAAASGRNVTLSMTPGNTTYGAPKYRLRIQRTGDTQMYALGDNALAYTLEEAYRGAPQPAYTETNLNSYTQVVPLIGQTMSLPKDTAYQYRMSIAIPVPTTAAPGAENSTQFTASELTAVLARGTNTIDIISGAVREAQLDASSVSNIKIKDGSIVASEKVVTNSITTELLNVLAKNKINNFSITGTLEGWTTTGTLEDDASGFKKLRFTSTYSGFTSNVFTVQPNEICSFEFGIACPNYTSLSGAYIGLTYGQNFRQYTWSFTLNKWTAGSVNSNAYFINNYRATTVKYYKTYILGSNVSINDIPAPSATDATYSLYALQLQGTDTTARIRTGFNPITAGTYWEIYNPQIYSGQGAKIVAQNILVKNLSAINSKLGEIQGDDGTNYKLVMGSGGSAAEGTFLLGAKTDAAYFRRYKVGNDWFLDIKTSNFIVDSAASTIIGPFLVKSTAATADTAALLQATPATSTVNIRGSLYLPAATTESRAIEIGTGRTGNGLAYIDLIGDATYTDYGLRIIRGNSGPNTTTQLIHRGTGTFDIKTNDAAAVRIMTRSVSRLHVASDGTITIGGVLQCPGDTVMNWYDLNLSSLSSTNFYPLVFTPVGFEHFGELHSPSLVGADPYNQNTVSFRWLTQGWSDTPPQLELTFGKYDASETTIGAFVRGDRNGCRAIYVRGGRNYRMRSNYAPSLKTASYTYGDETYAPGTLPYGTNTNATVAWNSADAGSAKMYKYIGGTLRVAGNVYGNLTGNADTATKWANARTLALTGAVTGSVSINGASNRTMITGFPSNSASRIVADLGFARMYRFKSTDIRKFAYAKVWELLPLGYIGNIGCIGRFGNTAVTRLQLTGTELNLVDNGNGLITTLPNNSLAPLGSDLDLFVLNVNAT